MQAELQTALFHAFDTLNLPANEKLQRSAGDAARRRRAGSLRSASAVPGLRHLFVMVDSFLHQAGMTAGLERNLAMKGIAMTLWPCPAGEPCVTDVCAAVAQLRDARCDGVVAFGGGSVLMRRRRWRCWSPILSRRWGDDGAQRVASTSAADRGADHRWHRV